jgi:hypothetical protein
LIVADTLLEKAMQFANAICCFGRDPQTKLKAGSKYVYNGFLQQLLDQTYTSKIFLAIYVHIFKPKLVVTVNKLQRHLNKKNYFGREEFQLMVEQALDDTKLSGRKITIQRIAIIALAFIIGLRPSSLGPCEKAYEEQEKARYSQNLFCFVTERSLSFPR